MTKKTFINDEGTSSFNTTTLAMLYTYWHDLNKDGITFPTIDEQKEIEELASLIPGNTVLTQITVQETTTGEFVYTYVFKGSGTCNLDSLTKLRSYIQGHITEFLSKVNDLTDNEGYSYITHIKGTNLIIGTFIIH